MWKNAFCTKSNWIQGLQACCRHECQKKHCPWKVENWIGVFVALVGYFFMHNSHFGFAWGCCTTDHKPLFKLPLRNHRWATGKIQIYISRVSVAQRCFSCACSCWSHSSSNFLLMWNFSWLVRTLRPHSPPQEIIGEQLVRSRFILVESAWLRDSFHVLVLVGAI